MLFWRDDDSGVHLASERDLLIREADEAFDANDKASCVDTIDRLYVLLDETLVSPRQAQPSMMGRRNS